MKNNTPQELGEELVESSAVVGAVKREAQSSLAVGYFTDTVMPTPQQRDPMINSRLHFDLGLGINYASNKWRLGIKYLHKSNGEIALPNRGYNFIITELTFLI
jgi:hypothetical protein